LLVEGVGRPDSIVNEIQSLVGLLREKNLLGYWADKGHNATIIFMKMEDSFGPSVLSSSGVTKWLRVLRRGEDIFEQCECSGRPEDPLMVLKVVDFLNLNPFASVHQIAPPVKTPRSTAFDHLNGSG
jgi:hypothetical protein